MNFGDVEWRVAEARFVYLERNQYTGQSRFLPFFGCKRIEREIFGAPFAPKRNWYTRQLGFIFRFSGSG